MSGRVRKLDRKKASPFRTAQESTKFIGAFLPPPLVDQVRLVAVARGQSLQKLVQEVLQNWSQWSPDAIPEVAITCLAERAISEWERRVAAGAVKDSKRQVTQFLKEVASELRRKKLAEHYVEMVVGRVVKKLEENGDAADEEGI